jgi:putative MATE family efflux protein
LFLYNIANAIFNGLGDSKTSLYFLIFSSVLNIILDYVFVAHFQMGVAGVAWATFIAQGLASVLAVFALLRRIRGVETEGEIKRFDGSVLKQMSKIAVPSILQQSAVSVGQLLVQALVNSYGASVIAGYAAAIKLDSFMKMIIMSMGNAMSSYTAQNAGARKLERVKSGMSVAVKLLLVYSVIIIGIVQLFGDNMIGWFMSEGTDMTTRLEVINVGTTYMRVVTFSYLIFSWVMVGNGVLRGAGAMKGYTVATFIDLGIRVAGAYVLAYIMGYNAIWWAIPIGWSVAAVLVFIFLRKGDWKKRWM